MLNAEKVAKFHVIRARMKKGDSEIFATHARPTRQDRAPVHQPHRGLNQRSHLAPHAIPNFPQERRTHHDTHRRRQSRPGGMDVKLWRWRACDSTRYPPSWPKNHAFPHFDKRGAREDFQMITVHNPSSATICSSPAFL